jgi:hypothetical protein
MKEPQFNASRITGIADFGWKINVFRRLSAAWQDKMPARNDQGVREFRVQIHGRLFVAEQGEKDIGKGGLDKTVGEILTPTVLQQIRQLSVPIWARGLALLLALGAMFSGAWLLWFGVLSCPGGCNEKLMDSGVKVLSVSLVPVLILVYLVFAETGVRALKRKTRELLEQTVIDAFRIEESSLPPMVSDRDVSASEAKLSAPISGPTAYYQLRVKRQTGAATLSFQLDFNVTKVNVVIYLPWIEHEVGEDLNKAVKARLCGTFEGARHEGYDFDANVARITVDGKTFVVLCARKRLRQDFLWDPGSKLYFVQDLRFFLFSLMVEADGLCCESA